MYLPAETPILIVGAGPCGMAAALSLYHQGIKDVVVVDATEPGKNASRAMVIHAATLEALETIKCIDIILPLGVQVGKLGVHEGSSFLLTADFSLLADKTKFPFGMLIPQSSTERAMLERLTQLGIHVLRPLRVVSVKECSDNSGMLDVSFESGEVIKTKYVIGADGAQSAVGSDSSRAWVRFIRRRTTRLWRPVADGLPKSRVPSVVPGQVPSRDPSRP